MEHFEEVLTIFAQVFHPLTTVHRRRLVVVVVVVYDLATRPKFRILRSDIDRVSDLYEIYHEQLWLQK